MDHKDMDTLKFVVVGDGAVAKSSLLMTYVHKEFPAEYIPRCENRSATAVVDGKTVNLDLVDTVGQGGFDRVRPLLYPETDIFLVCFSLISPSSFEHVLSFWYPELQYHCPLTPIILLGTKQDLCHDEEVTRSLRKRKIVPITTQQGMEMSREIRSIKYLECSALTEKGLEEVFNEAIRTALHNKPRK